MKKSHNQPLKTLLAFISPMKQKFILKIERGHSFLRSPLKPFFGKFINSFFVIARKKIKKFWKKAMIKDQYCRSDESEQNGDKISKNTRGDSFLV